MSLTYNLLLAVCSFILISTSTLSGATEHPKSLSDEEMTSLRTFWGTKLTTKKYIEPDSLESLSRIIKTNFKNSTKYRITGARHADNLGAHSPSMMISLKSLPLMIHYDPLTQIVKASSGLNLFQINKYLFQFKRVLHGTPSIGTQTLGGALATGSHSEGKNALLSDSVVSIKVILPDGKTKIIRSETDLELFRVSLGLLGVLVEVEIQTYPLRKYSINNEYIKFKELNIHDLQNKNKNSDRLLIDYFPYSRITRVALWNEIKEKNDEDYTGYKNAEHFESDFFDNMKYQLALGSYRLSRFINFKFNFYDYLLNFELERRLGRSEKILSTLSSEILFNNNPNPDLRIPWDERVMAGFPEQLYDFEIAVPQQQLHSTMAYISDKFLDLKNEFNIYCPNPFFIRFGQKSTKSILGMNAKKDVAFITIPIPKKWEKKFQEIIKYVVVNFEGRIHFGKYIFDFDHDVLFKNFDSKDVKRFLHYRKSLDRKNLLINDYAKKFIFL